jgi:hypothetical protein
MALGRAILGWLAILLLAAPFGFLVPLPLSAVRRPADRLGCGCRTAGHRRLRECLSHGGRQCFAGKPFDCFGSGA